MRLYEAEPLIQADSTNIALNIRTTTCVGEVAQQPQLAQGKHLQQGHGRIAIAVDLAVPAKKRLALGRNTASMNTPVLL